MERDPEISVFRSTPIPAAAELLTVSPVGQSDIPDSIIAALGDKAWGDVDILDWRRIGAPISVARNYISPGAFLFYLPSLLISPAELNGADALFVIDALSPAGAKGVQKKAWWAAFFCLTSAEERCVVQNYLHKLREYARKGGNDDVVSEIDGAIEGWR